MSDKNDFMAGVKAARAGADCPACASDEFQRGYGIQKAAELAHFSESQADEAIRLFLNREKGITRHETK